MSGTNDDDELWIRATSNTAGTTTNGIDRYISDFYAGTVSTFSLSSWPQPKTLTEKEVAELKYDDAKERYEDALAELKRATQLRRKLNKTRKELISAQMELALVGDMKDDIDFEKLEKDLPVVKKAQKKRRK